MKEQLLRFLHELPYLIVLAVIAYYLREIMVYLGAIWYLFFTSSGGFTS